MQFARILRRAGLPIGPGQVIAGLEALQVIDLGHRDDVYWALHAVLVKRHAQSDLFRLAFERFWTVHATGASESSQDEPAKLHGIEPEDTPQPRRLDEAFGSSLQRGDPVPPSEHNIAGGFMRYFRVHVGLCAHAVALPARHHQ
jgi:uncharacterized protein with von Willebrand factor type A (vWA) domain